MASESWIDAVKPPVPGSKAAQLRAMREANFEEAGSRKPLRRAAIPGLPKALVTPPALTAALRKTKPKKKGR